MNFLKLTQKAFAEMKAVPVNANGKRNGNRLNVPFHAYIEGLEKLGYTRHAATETAFKMYWKFKG